MIDVLSRVSNWAEAVDSGAAVQRDIKEKAAWLEFARRLSAEDWNAAITRVQNTSIPLACDDYLGAQGIPTFVAHRLDPEEIYLDSSLEPDSHRPWWAGTDAEDLQDDRYLYDQVAIRNLSIQAAVRAPLYAFRPPPVTPAFHRASFPRNQQWRGPLMGYSASPSPPSPVRRSPPLVIPPSEEEPGLQISPNCEAALLERIAIHSNHKQWIKPPPLFDNRRKGQWSRWVTDDWLVCTQVGKKSSDLDDYEYCLYDRYNKRRIYFNSIPDPPPGAVSDIAIYGRPAPRARFEDIGRREYPATLSLANPIPLSPASALPLRLGLKDPTPTPLQKGHMDDAPVDTPPSDIKAQEGDDVDMDGVSQPVDTPLSSAKAQEGDDVEMGGVSRPVDTPPSNTKAQEGDDVEMDEVSLGPSSEASHPGPSPPTLTPAPSLFLRLTAFPSSTSWDVLKRSFLDLAERWPDIHITALVRTVTQAATRTEHRHTVWISAPSVDSTQALHLSYAGPVPGGPPTTLLWATKEEFDQASAAAADSWFSSAPSRPASPDRITVRGKRTSGHSLLPRAPPQPSLADAPPARRPDPLVPIVGVRCLEDPTRLVDRCHHHQIA
ncbi:hypothetical protein LshimejAT787_1303800 [Lyophyllum shimeji]|uniref:Uncharacterized protein n=1 Tax=Lyophyllum shimeji TaxID=47721 RepID=A0A9P3UQ38_LYOSH|nr:hypothetical protein LshimejAT787_1303800 [Lyophyllum shimeji]